MNLNFTIQMKKTVSVYSPYKQFLSEGFEFKSELVTYNVKLSNDLKHLTKTFNCQRILLIFKSIIVIKYVFFFVFDTNFYGSTTGYIQDYNELIKDFPNIVQSQIRGIVASFFMTKNINKRVMVETRIYWPLTEENNKM